MIKCLLIANTSKDEQSLISALYYSITLNLSVKRKVVDKVPDMLFWYNFLTFIQFIHYLLQAKLKQVMARCLA